MSMAPRVKSAGVHWDAEKVRQTLPVLDAGVSLDVAEAEWFAAAMETCDPWLIQAHRERFEKLRGGRITMCGAIARARGFVAAWERCFAGLDARLDGGELSAADRMEYVDGRVERARARLKREEALSDGF